MVSASIRTNQFSHKSRIVIENDSDTGVSYLHDDGVIHRFYVHPFLSIISAIRTLFNRFPNSLYIDSYYILGSITIDIDLTYRISGR